MFHNINYYKCLFYFRTAQNRQNSKKKNDNFINPQLDFTIKNYKTETHKN